MRIRRRLLPQLIRPVEWRYLWRAVRRLHAPIRCRRSGRSGRDSSRDSILLLRIDVDRFNGKAAIALVAEVGDDESASRLARRSPKLLWHIVQKSISVCRQRGETKSKRHGAEGTWVKRAHKILESSQLEQEWLRLMGYNNYSRTSLELIIIYFALTDIYVASSWLFHSRLT